MNTKKIFSFFYLTVISLALLLPAVTALAVEDYTVLAPLPGTTINCDDTQLGSSNCKTTLQRYLPGVFNLLIGLAGVAAVLRIVIGGFIYMSSDAIQGKEDGKNMIWNSIKGLVLVIAAWLILYTINPALLTLNLNIEPVSVSAPASTGTGGGTLGGGGVAPWVPLTQAQVEESDAIRRFLQESQRGYPVYTYASPCVRVGVSTGCVNLNGLSMNVQNTLLDLRRVCGTTCELTITGGTEGGHSVNSQHNVGNAVDVRWQPALDSYITTNDRTPEQTSLGPKYTLQINGRTVTFLKESNPNHWHIEVR